MNKIEYPEIKKIKEAQTKIQTDYFRDFRFWCVICKDFKSLPSDASDLGGWVCASHQIRSKK